MKYHRGDVTDLPVLEAGVRDESPWVAQHAAVSLLELGGRERLESMIALGHGRSALLREVLSEEGEA